MYLVSEKVATRIASNLVSVETTIPMMEAVFAELDKGEVELLPVTITRGPAVGTTFGAKGCIIRSMGLFGFKLGSYWPTNAALGLPGHGSTTILFDPETGFPMAIIGAKHISAIRTAALDAIAIRQLSRPDSQTLAIVGCGYQAWHEYLAARAVRPIDRVLVWGRNPDSAAAFAHRVFREHGIAAEAAALETAVASADIVITATPSSIPLVEKAWVRPGTHISAMGADTKGKQELTVDLVGNATLYADIVEQSVTIGEFKAAFAAGLIGREAITPIGKVMSGPMQARTSDDITIFDSSGTAFQDLVIAKAVLDTALSEGLAVSIDA
jgi:alanine dehydrogenase